MITPTEKANPGVCAGKQGGHSLPGAAASTTLQSTPLSGITFAQVPDHAPKPVGLSALDELERR